MQRFTRSFVIMDVTLTFLYFSDDRKDVAGTFIDLIVFGIPEIITLTASVGSLGVVYKLREDLCESCVLNFHTNKFYRQKYIT